MSLNPTYEVTNLRNGAFQNATFQNGTLQMLTENYRVQSGHREILYYAKGKLSYRKSDPYNG
jgi:hypothetical protein